MQNKLRILYLQNRSDQTILSQSDLAIERDYHEGR